MSKYYGTYSQYLGAQRCCDLRGQGPQGPAGQNGSNGSNGDSTVATAAAVAAIDGKFTNGILLEFELAVVVVVVFELVELFKKFIL